MDRIVLRQDTLRRSLRRDALDGLLVCNETNVSYLTGFSGDSSYLLIGRDRTVLLSDGRYAQQIEQECPGLESSVRRTTGEKMCDVIANLVRRMRVRRLAFESSAMRVSELGELQNSLPKVELVGWAGRVEALRARKDPDEVRQIQEAIAFAERAFRMFRDGLRPGDTEKAAADQLEMFIRRTGARRGAFDAIVAVGPNAALPHARPGDRVVDEGLPVLIDWGASGRFYQSDLTRVLVSRRIPAKLEAIYGVVLKAQERAIQRIRPGIVAKEIDAEARAIIEKSGFGSFLKHGTGHGIGREVHEAPALRPNSETVLKSGMVVTVEPGIYVPNWGGIRIEDDVLVTRDGHEVLSTLPKNLDSVLVL